MHQEQVEVLVGDLLIKKVAAQYRVSNFRMRQERVEVLVGILTIIAA